MKDIYSLEEVREMEAAEVAEIVKRGIRTGTEFKLVRKFVDLRANDIAALLDVAPETVSRWESGKLALPRFAVFVLGEYYERPQVTRRKLEALAG